MKNIFIKLFCTILIFSITKANCQKNDEYINQNAIELTSIKKLNDSLYKKFKTFNLLMIGEMHGTNECADFVNALANLLTKNSDSVQVGMEILSSKMPDFAAHPTLKSLLSSTYFNEENIDGRRSQAWFDVLKSGLKNKKVKFFFFDVEGFNRDSLMYENVKQNILSNPNYKTVLLCGNYHNRVKSLNTKIKMGTYIMNDKSLDLKTKTCSININYVGGEMMNSDGNGLQLKKLHNPESQFANAVKFNQCLLFYPQDIDYDYNAILFIRNLTASPSVNLKSTN